MKFTVPKESNRRQTPASSFFVEGEQQKKREEPLEVPAFMRRVLSARRKTGQAKKARKNRLMLHRLSHGQKDRRL